MSNLPDDVNQKMIDEQYSEIVPVREKYDFRHGDSQSYSYDTLSDFLVDCREHGGASKSEYCGLVAHLENLLQNHESALLEIMQLNGQVRELKAKLARRVA